MVERKGLVIAIKCTQDAMQPSVQIPCLVSKGLSNAYNIILKINLFIFLLHRFLHLQNKFYFLQTKFFFQQSNRHFSHGLLQKLLLRYICNIAKQKSAFDSQNFKYISYHRVFKF